MNVVDKLAAKLWTNWWHAYRLVAIANDVDLQWIPDILAGDPNKPMSRLLDWYDNRPKGVLDKNDLRALRRRAIDAKRRR